MTEYKLSAALEGHEDDVRSVVFPRPDSVISASRDATVRLWKQTSTSPPTYDSTIAQQGSAFINVVTYIHPLPDYPDGLIVSGGKDTIIELRQPGKPPDENAERLLIGHTSNVCALDSYTDGKTGYLVSGGWDAQSRVWPIGKWESSTGLEGHEASVWGVLAYSSDTVITGCADKLIRVYSVGGKLLQTIRGSSEVVRALCKLPSNSNSGAEFASAGNDAIVRLWTLDGKEVAQYHGHESFIYSLAILPSGELASSSEDRTVRIWGDGRCVQTITHPAISVWAVAACAENGDIVTGASDRIVRVFSRSQERQASEAAISALEDFVKSSSIPQQQMGDINKEKLPGPEFLTQKSGTKEGQVQMIRESNGNISAHQWSASQQQWTNVGTVVDAVGSSGKKAEYQGQDYDYVFDVDIEDGKPTLKLPYNLSQNPYEVARQFVGNNELPVSYLDQVANFIITNTQGATIGQNSTSAVDSSFSEPPPQQPRRKVLPQTEYLSITTAALPTITKKIEETNEQLLSSGQKHISFNPADLSIIRPFTKALDTTLKSPPSLEANANLERGANLVIRIVTSWPPQNRLPGLDLFRLLAAAFPNFPNQYDLLEVLNRSGAFAPEANPNQTMLAIRALANLFVHSAGRRFSLSQLDAIRTLTQPTMTRKTDSNRNIQIAFVTLHINYAVLLSSDDAAHMSEQYVPLLLDDMVDFLGSKGVTDSEVIYRSLVAIGTFVALPSVINDAQRKVAIGNVLNEVLRTPKEPRINGVAAEIRDSL